VQPEAGYKNFKENVKMVTEGKFSKITTQVYAEKPNWPTSGSIEFCGLFLRYRPELDYVLRDVSLKIRSGEKIGIIGRTGAGKSTMINSIIRAVERSQGQIKIDGVDITEPDLKLLRSSITVLSQVITHNSLPQVQSKMNRFWEAGPLSVQRFNQRKH
jgi:ABC-type multidrug transport system fused ATPase/permease subunit